MAAVEVEHEEAADDVEEPMVNRAAGIAYASGDRASVTSSVA